MVEAENEIISQDWYENILAIAEAFRALEQDKATLEAKLAELEKQEPAAHAWDVPKFPGSSQMVTELCSPRQKDAYPVFKRPSPAVSLAELVTDGWKLVPVEPNRQMMAQGHFALGGTDRGKFRRIYQAMLAAAPEVGE